MMQNARDVLVKWSKTTSTNLLPSTTLHKRLQTLRLLPRHRRLLLAQHPHDRIRRHPGLRLENLIQALRLADGRDPLHLLRQQHPRRGPRQTAPPAQAHRAVVHLEDLARDVCGRARCVGAVRERYRVAGRDRVGVAGRADVGRVVVPVGVGGEVADGGPDGGGGRVDGGRAVPGPDAFVAGDAWGLEDFAVDHVDGLGGVDVDEG